MSNDTFEDTSETEEDRSIVKPGLLATGTLALGATANATMAQDGSQGRPGLMYSYQYYPNTDFTVIDRLPQESTVRLLQTADGETPPEIGDLGGWRGHVIQYDVGGDGIPAFLFLDERRMAEGETSSTGGDAQMFTSDRNLLRTTLGGEGGGGADGGQQTETGGENGQESQESADAEGNGAQDGQGGQDGESDGLEISVSLNGDDNESE